MAAAGVRPAEVASDAEFFRRLSLDLVGRIPTAAEARAFLADQAPNKPERAIDRLLSRPRHASHLASVWRGWLLPEITANPEARYFQIGFEKWLAERFHQGVGYDQIVRDLLAAPLPSSADEAAHVLREPERPNPLAFYAVKDAAPGKLAAAATRSFLGLRLECAQCHDHPFGRWTQQQFWNQAAFFAGIERQGRGMFAPLTEDPTKRTVKPDGGKREIAAAFLTPVAVKEATPRAQFAAWVVARENSFFAKAAVNRVWGMLFNVGLVDPIDDFHDANAPSHPEVLNELASAFVASGFDLDYVFKALCRTRAYRRTSSGPAASNPRLFDRMAIKGLSAEQFYDSLALATGWAHAGAASQRAEGEREPARQRFLEQFAPRSWPAQPETAVGQALAMMNGTTFNGAADRRSPLLTSVLDAPSWTTAERIEALFFAALGRAPTAGEAAPFVEHADRDPLIRRPQHYEDVYWALLNSAEFRFNH
jgi:hypothetical protein